MSMDVVGKCGWKCWEVYARVKKCWVFLHAWADQECFDECGQVWLVGQWMLVDVIDDLNL